MRITTSPPNQQYQLNPIEIDTINAVKQQDTSSVPITYDRLQQLTGYSPEQVQMAIKSLIDKKLLRKLFAPRRLV